MKSPATLSRYCRIILIGGLFLPLFASAAGARSYVSLKGGFHFTYPDEWVQVDYNTVDLFLQQQGADSTMFGYEAVFAPADASPYFAEEYLFLTIDTFEILHPYQIDSVVQQMFKGFGKGVRYFPVGDSPANVASTAPNWDKEEKILRVVNDITRGGEVFKKNVTYKKFYDKGIANFYFYTPDSAFEQTAQGFAEMVLSFSTENLDSAFDAEQVKAAKLDESILKGEEQKKLNYWTIGTPSFVIILIIILAARKKRKTQKKAA